MRALLGAATVICLWLGLVVHRAESQRRTVLAIEAAGGRVWYEHDPNVGGLLRRWPIEHSNERWDRFARHYLHDVAEVNLSQTQCNDELLAQVASLGEIKSLALDATKITDQGMRSLRYLANLTYLSITRTQIADAGLSHLQNCDQLAILFLSDTLVTNAGMDYIKRLPRLKWVTVDGSKVTQSGVDAMNAANPTLAEVGF